MNAVQLIESMDFTMNANEDTQSKFGNNLRNALTVSRLLR